MLYSGAGNIPRRLVRLTRELSPASDSLYDVAGLSSTICSSSSGDWAATRSARQPPKLSARAVAATEASPGRSVELRRQSCRSALTSAHASSVRASQSWRLGGGRLSVHTW
eukprot:365535-Chlamydomonas_euryale.AAC.9